MALLLVTLPVFSQTSQGTIQGGVFDQTGGAVAGASVSVIDIARGATRSLTTDNAGQYVAPNLTPGTYTVRAEAKGFRTVEHSGVLVEVGKNLRVDLTVQPGEQTQTITVTGEIPAIDTTDATLGGTVSNEAINNLPLNGRNFDRLLQLRPGVVTSVGSGAGSNESTNGMRVGDDIVLVEGITTIAQSAQITSVINSSYRFGDSGSLLPIDAIQEFDTEQDPKAEYGWKAGSVVTVGVKSGTNSLHGTAYAFGRDAQATDAGNFFRTPGVNPVTPASVEQFGASAGGRIIKDKLFWFANYEGLRATLGDVAVDTIPADVAMGNTSFSMVDACNALGRNNVNPLSAQLAGLPANSCVPQPSSASVENLFPFTTNTNTKGNFAPGLISTGPLDNGIFKADYIIGPHHHLSGMYYASKSSQVNNYASGQLLPQWEANVLTDVQMYAGDWTWTPNSSWVNDFRMGYAYLDDQTIPADINNIASAPWPNGYGMNTGVTNPLYGGLPQIQISGFSGYLGAGQRSSIRGPEGNLDFVESVSYLRGKHAFRFGFEYLDIVFDGNTFSQAQGQVSFSSLQNFLTGTPRSGTILLGDATLAARGHWLAGFVQDDWRLTTRVTLNLGLRYEYYGPPVEENNYVGNFNPNVNPLTTPAVEQVGPGAPISSMFNADYKDFAPRLGVAWDVRGNGKTVVRAGASVLRDPATFSDLVNVVPFGANFPTLNINTSGTQANLHTPDQPSLTPGQINWNQTGPTIFPNGSVTVNGTNYTGVTCTPASIPNPGPCGTGAVVPNLRQSYVAAWNLDVQRAVTNSLTLDVAYVGNHSFNQELSEDLNQPALGAGWAGATAAACLASAPLYNQCKVNTAAEVGPYSATFPYLNYITAATFGDYSNYDALQLTLNERISHGLSFLAGYTYAHALAALDSGSATPILPSTNTNLGLNYGNTNQDVRHRFTFSPTYAIPGRKVPGQMLEGWTAGGILTLQSGLPWSPNDVTNDFLGTGEFNNSTGASSVTQPWNYTGPASAFDSGAAAIPCFSALGSKGSPVLPGCTPYTGGQPPAACMSAAQANGELAVASLMNFGCYLQNGGVLTPPAYGTIGNASRNLFRSPAYYNVDFSVSKIWKIRERYSAQFRVEFFNLLNRTDFAVPATKASDPNAGLTGQFGCSCSTPDLSNPVFGSGGPRHIQFGLKLTY